MASYPKWLELIDQRYAESFSKLFEKLDQQLSLAVKEKLSGGIYAEFIKMVAGQVAKNQRVNTTISLLSAMRTVYGSEVISPKFINMRTDICSTLIELCKILKEVEDMIKYQKTFDKLNEKTIFYN